MPRAKDDGRPFPAAHDGNELSSAKRNDNNPRLSRRTFFSDYIDSQLQALGKQHDYEKLEEQIEKLNYPALWKILGKRISKGKKRRRRLTAPC
jgi:hypothetical protein